MINAELIAAKKKLRFRAIQAASRKFYKSLIREGETAGILEHKTLHAARLRAAIQQAMEFADGEKPWVFQVKANYRRWQESGRPIFKIPLGFNCTSGGGPGRRGTMYCYGLRVAFDRQAAKTVVEGDEYIRSPRPLGD